MMLVSIYIATCNFVTQKYVYLCNIVLCLNVTTSLHREKQMQVPKATWFPSLVKVDTGVQMWYIDTCINTVWTPAVTPPQSLPNQF